VIFLKLFKGISCFFNRIAFEIRRIKLKACLISAAIFLGIVVITWIFGGNIHRALVFYQQPRSAMPIALMFILWAISFAFIGFVVGGIIFGCEKYKKQHIYKIFVLIVLMSLFSYIAYPLFFGGLASFLSFLSYLIACVFCVLAIIYSFKLFSLWTICLAMHLLWLIYNVVISLGFCLLN
jgi:hypothetical protein